MPGDLVELARFSSSAEAAIVRGRLDADGIPSEMAGEAVGSWFWHFGPAVGGVRLLVREEDAKLAQKILREQGFNWQDTEAMDFGTDEDEGVDADGEPSVPEDLTRAWRAALIGMLMCPPLLNIYSCWLLVRHKFFVDYDANWRVPVACAVNGVVLAITMSFLLLIATSVAPQREAEPPVYYGPDGEPAEPSVVETQEEYTIPLHP